MSHPDPLPAGGIRTRPVPACPLCGTPCQPLHERLVDRLFGAPGEWDIVRCPEHTCGLLWLNPAPLAEDLSRAYRGYYTHNAVGAGRRGAGALLRRWLRDAHAHARFGYPVPAAPLKRALAWTLLPFPTLREHLDHLFMYLPPRPGGRMLDVGCGEGRILAALRDLGWRVEGVDVDPDAVAAATGRGLAVRLGTLADQRYPDGAFDAVTMNHVIEHVPDPVGLLAETRRVLAPGGRLVLLTPNADGLGHRRHGGAWRGLEPPRHLHIFRAPALERAVRAAGFRTWSLSSLATGAVYIELESRRAATGAPPARRDRSAARALERAERRDLTTDPWAGEELLLIATRD